MHKIAEESGQTFAKFPMKGKLVSRRHRLEQVAEAAVDASVVPSVAILLCIHNGKHFLAEQLESIAQQSHRNWCLYASDDGECEDSRKIVAEFALRFDKSRVMLVNGPRKGFVQNFLSLTCDRFIDADYFAYSDQDDIWHKDKLENAIKSLAQTGIDVPGLYCSRTIIVDDSNQEIGLSPLFSKPASFANALVQNIGGGNTMIFNRKARQTAIDVGQDVPAISHDWWMYLLVTGVGGKVVYDPNPSVRYRQHGNNLVGCNITWRARFHRIYFLFKGRFKEYNDRNLESLMAAYQFLTPRNRKLIDDFAELKKSNLLDRVRIYKKNRIYRQTLFGNIGLWVAILFNKL